MTVSLATTVFLSGGVYPGQFQWCALAIAVASVLIVQSAPGRREPFTKSKYTFGLSALALLLGWMIFQLIPLPPAVVSYLSPRHWNAAVAARRITGQSGGRWIALSLAPAAGIQRLLDVSAAMAIFVTAREMGRQWWDRIWIVIAPVIGVAWLESILGIAQFYIMRASGAEAGAAHGTFVNHDHFSGLLEMALPVALLWSIATWRHGSTAQRSGPALGTALLLMVSACLLMGVIMSLSRMGFISTLVAVGFTTIMLVVSLTLERKRGGRQRKWLIPLALAVPLLIAVFLPTRELILNFSRLPRGAEISGDTRVRIWQDTRKVISDYAWVGTGLGAYERGMYARQTAVPNNTVDFAHNDYLQVLAELGVAGATLALIVAAWVASGVLFAALRYRNSPSWPLAMGLAGGLLALAVHSFADFNLYIPGNALAFAWLSGVAVSPGLTVKG